MIGHILQSAMAPAQRVRVAGRSAGRDEGRAQRGDTNTRPGCGDLVDETKSSGRWPAVDGYARDTPGLSDLFPASSA